MTTRKHPIVAIDGPSGAGKSTVAQAVANALSFRKIDTGALYRTIAFLALEANVDWGDGDAMGRFAESVVLQMDPAAKGFVLIANGQTVGDEIRSGTISQGASLVSAHPSVRAALLGIQRNMGADGGVVLEGRDIGTVVFPDAEIKVFLHASPEVRAKRRAIDLQKSGDNRSVEEILADMQARDRRDSRRVVAPLKPAKDAYQLDASDKNIDEVVAEIVGLVTRFRA